MFEKKGCADERCKKDFMKFTGYSQEKTDKLWPDIILDKNSEVHNRFSSYQLGKIVKVLQKTTRDIGAEYNKKADYILSIHPKYFDMTSHAHEVHNPEVYLPYISKLLIWRYGNTINPSHVDISRLIGNNLKILPALKQTRDMAVKARKQNNISSACRLSMPRLMVIRATLSCLKIFTSFPC